MNNSQYRDLNTKTNNISNKKKIIKKKNTTKQKINKFKTVVDKSTNYPQYEDFFRELSKITRNKNK